jgi:alkylation response protein AidB-like acyl-CoA dehydrogenase
MRDLDLPYLQAAHHQLRSEVRAALDRQVVPYAERWETARHIPREAWRALGGAGFFAFPPSGEGFLDTAVFLEELGRTGYSGIRSAVGIHAYMAPSYLELFGTPEQREAYLPGVRSGERIAALAITEEEAGTDMRGLRTRAEPDGEGGYRVTGTKWYVANASHADFYVTALRTSHHNSVGGDLAGLSLLVIDAALPGVTRSPAPLMGMNAADVCHVDFDAVPVRPGHLIGKAGRGMLHLMRALDFERLAVGLMAVGGGLYCVELLDRFVREHLVGGEPLSTRQAVRHRVAELMAELDTVRHYAYHAAWLHSRGCLDTGTASVLKLRATELAVQTAQTCVQYHGSRGFEEHSAAARLYREAIAGTITAGASEILRELIFEELRVASELP